MVNNDDEDIVLYHFGSDGVGGIYGRMAPDGFHQVFMLGGLSWQ